MEDKRVAVVRQESGWFASRSKIRNVVFLSAFASAVFASALLMFAIQPMIAKALLPKLGGTPQVWNTCMVFFQTVLFAGYLHAHFTQIAVGLRRQAALHIAMASLALLTLPIALSPSSGTPDSAHPILWLLQALTLTVGAPLFVISTTAPLLQKWFAHTRHPAARDPYFMYAASNIGSLLALLGYPTVIEPRLDLAEQTRLWTIGFVAFTGLIGTCFWLFWRDYTKTPIAAESRVSFAEAQPVSGLLRLKWLALSFVPSSLLLGVTTYVTIDIAAVPLFWIVPLALYLLTFVLVFAGRRLIPHNHALRAQAVLLTFVAVTMLKPGMVPWLWMLVMHLATFFITALVCHGELVRCRPDTAHLTEFYLWMSLGGMLGGMFNALFAPALFSSLQEYPLILVAACFLRARADVNSKRQRRVDFTAPLAYTAALLLAIWGITLIDEGFGVWRIAGLIIVLLGAGLTIISFSDRHIRFGLGIAATLASVPVLNLFGALADNPLDRELLTERSFFGIHKVYRDDSRGFSVLMHGTTIHGAQSLNPQKALQPGSYYHTEGPFADLFEAMKGSLGSKPVAVVGLGAGAIACYGRAESHWTYYEIDPLVEKIARDERYFTFLRDCPPHVRVVIGDARLTLRDAPNSSYGLILVDAFSSDAIPTHLLTREAIAGYMQKLAPEGVLALHISNRHIDLAPVVGNLAVDAGLVGRLSEFPKPEGKGLNAAHAQLAVLAHKESDLGQIAASNLWGALPKQSQTRIWSDGYINILAAFKMFH
jgi:hypothetical protein